MAQESRWAKLLISGDARYFEDAVRSKAISIPYRFSKPVPIRSLFLFEASSYCELFIG